MPDVQQNERNRIAQLILKYSILASSISATAAALLGLFVYWFLGSSIASLVAMYGGQTEPNMTEPVVPMTSIVFWVFAFLAIIFREKNSLFIWCGLICGLSSLGLLIQEELILIELASLP